MVKLIARWPRGATPRIAITETENAAPVPRIAIQYRFPAVMAAGDELSVFQTPALA